MSDIFEEVEEELQKDRVGEMWKKYGIFAWILGALIIGAVAYNEYRGTQAVKAKEVRLVQLESASQKLADGEYDAALTEFGALSDTKSGLSPLAAQFIAGAQMDGKGDADAAAAALLTVADAKGAPFEKLSVLKAAYLTSDSVTLAELETQLGELLQDEGPMGALALELVSAKALAEGDIDRARSGFSRLTLDTGALTGEIRIPQGVMQRAQLALASMPPAPTETQTPAVPDAPTDTPDTDAGEPATEEANP